MNIPEHFFSPDYIPEDQDVIDHYISINPNCNIPKVIHTVKYLLNNRAGNNNVEGNGVISFGYFIYKYDQYLKNWNSKFSEKDEKFIGKADKKRDPEMFLIDGLYNNVYNIERNNRDNYILSKLPIDVLRSKLEIFYVLIRRETSIDKNKELIKKSKSNGTTFFKQPDSSGPF